MPTTLHHFSDRNGQLTGSRRTYTETLPMDLRAAEAHVREFYGRPVGVERLDGMTRFLYVGFSLTLE